MRDIGGPEVESLSGLRGYLVGFLHAWKSTSYPGLPYSEFLARSVRD